MSEKETITNEELRRQIKGNLEIAADTWPIHQLRVLETCANELALSGLYAEGLLHNGILSLYNLIYDEQGKIKLTSNPDDEQNIFRVLAKMIEENNTKNKAESASEATTSGEQGSGPVTDNNSSYKDFF